MHTEFMDALGAGLPANERLITCGFGGDPNHAPPNAWKPRQWAPGQELDLGAHWNAYVTVSSFVRAADKTWRRRGELFAAGRALMVDDVGTGPSARVAPEKVAGLRPSARVMTSPNNEQFWYFLSEPERDPVRFDGVIRSFITGKLLGADPGMAGIARVGRIPGFINGKPKYGGNFKVELQELNDRRYTVDDLLDGFSLKINGRKTSTVKLVSTEAVERNVAFLAAYKWLEQRQMFTSPGPDLSGWRQMHCPWADGHTGGVDTGAALSEPSDATNFYGGWKCHHGSCIGRGFRDLTEWIAEESAEELEQAAASAFAMMESQHE